eukprot:m.134668 g.134668  ORF g.134668 m.134668 type:complete len:87 (-) comp15976_c0_seq23:33-293(-)
MKEVKVRRGNGASTSQPKTCLTVRVRLIQLKFRLPYHQRLDRLYILCHLKPKLINIRSKADRIICCPKTDTTMSTLQPAYTQLANI